MENKFLGFYDTVVVGGGTAGVPAAIAAARGGVVYSFRNNNIDCALENQKEQRSGISETLREHRGSRNDKAGYFL